MPVSIIVLSILLAVAFVGAGVTKLTGQSAMRDAATHFGIAWERYRLIGVLEVAGAAGVLLGLAVTALGAIAAIALTLLMIAALTTHRRAGDPPAQNGPRCRPGRDQRGHRRSLPRPLGGRVHGGAVLADLRGDPERQDSLGRLERGRAVDLMPGERRDEGVPRGDPLGRRVVVGVGGGAEDQVGTG